MSGLKEFKYSIIVFFIALAFISSAFLILFWFFNIRNFPPQFGVGSWIIIFLILLIPTYFIELKLIKNWELSEKRKEIIIGTSLFCIMMMSFGLINLVSDFSDSQKTISTIEELNSSRRKYVSIGKFEIINKPIIYKYIKINTKSGTHYLQLYFLYPFKSQKDKFYCSLLFEKISDTKFFTEEEQMENFLNETKTEIRNYDFQKTNKFEYITVMDPNYDHYYDAVPDKQSIFLTPRKKIDNDSISFSIKYFVGLFLLYIAIFLLTKVENWK